MTSASLPWAGKAEFKVPLRGEKDKWVTSLAANGSMVQARGGKRHRLFHPLRKDCPWRKSLLEKRKITVLFNSAGERVILQDQWDGPMKNPDCSKKRSSVPFRGHGCSCLQLQPWPEILLRHRRHLQAMQRRSRLHRHSAVDSGGGWITGTARCS